MENVIEISNLSKTYANKFKALSPFNLTIQAGEIVGFVGQNGAGKSTTIRCILNMIKQTSGEVKIYGLDNQKDSKKIKEFTSFVPSEVSYYPGLKVKDIINYSMGFQNERNTQKAKYLYEFLEISPERKIDELSLGNRKKVSIIQALIKDPKIIILDEPTSGLTH